MEIIYSPPLPWREIQLWFWSDNFLALHKFADRISSAWTTPGPFLRNIPPPMMAGQVSHLAAKNCLRWDQGRFAHRVEAMAVALLYWQGWPVSICSHELVLVQTAL
jgi:hypothetical protein